MMTAQPFRAVLLAATLAGLLVAATAHAKLPPLSDEAKAKAAESAAKAAHGNRVANFQLCKSMDRVAAVYQAEARKAGKEVKPATETPSCADPGPFASAPPLEAAGAHSPAKTAAAPPSTKTPSAEQGKKKP